jgi:hypothetical protein
MDPELLVREQIRSGARLVRNLLLKDFPLEDAAWVRLSDDGWRLELVTPLVGSIGRRNALIQLLETANPEEHPDLDFDRIQLVSPQEVQYIHDAPNDRERLTAPSQIGLAVTDNAIERYRYNREPLVYEAQIARELLRIFPRDEVTIEPQTAPSVDFVVSHGEQLMAVEVKTWKHPIGTADVLSMLSISAALSMPVVLVTPREASRAASQIAAEHSDRLRLVTWQSDRDSENLQNAFE